jgi:phosphatidylinositol glycan class V
MQLLSRPLDRPTRSLVIVFLLWKALLLLIAVSSPGPGYDTSTGLALVKNHSTTTLPHLVGHIANKLTRWDAIYFITIAERDYVHEQEWAFGYGFTKLISLCTSGTVYGSISENMLTCFQLPEMQESFHMTD